ncbi:hypothetical protein MKEN_00454300 [Mycena kentingensis (nom. inval.)]|nr:hypothetical protein MKEN_00454300 [Mycena kentingensis (nom. inval.)]
MPMPRLAFIHKLANEHIAVPALSSIQRSYLHHEILRSYDKKTPLTAAQRTRIVDDALDGAPFKHQSTNVLQDAEEHAAIQAAVTASGTPKNAVRDRASGGDGDAVRDCIRGFARAGWRYAITKVVNNLWDANKRKAGTTKSSIASNKGNSELPLPKAMKLLDLVECTGRSKFVNERQEEIEALARTYEGGNPGANKHKAAKELWEKEDHSAWEDALNADMESVSPAERMSMLVIGISEALGKLQDSGRFPPFVATLQFGFLDSKQLCFEIGESVPQNSKILRGFREQYEDVSQAYLSAMHQWASDDLKDLERLSKKSLQASSKPSPTFQLSDDIDNLSMNEISSTMADFFANSYEHARGTREIPWSAVRAQPNRYFDADALSLRFNLDDPSNLDRSSRLDLAAALTRVAGPGSMCFFFPESAEIAAEPHEGIKQSILDLTQVAERAGRELDTLRAEAAHDGPEMVQAIQTAERILADVQLLVSKVAEVKARAIGAASGPAITTEVEQLGERVDGYVVEAKHNLRVAREAEKRDADRVAGEKAAEKERLAIEEAAKAEEARAADEAAKAEEARAEAARAEEARVVEDAARAKAKKHKKKYVPPQPPTGTTANEEEASGAPRKSSRISKRNAEEELSKEEPKRRRKRNW